MLSQRDGISWCVLAALITGGSITANAQQPRATLDRYCIGCHNNKLKTAGLALDDAGVENPAAHPEIWEKVVRRLRVRSMPPAGLPRPNDDAYVALISSLETSLDRAAAAHPDPGRTQTFRRLTRTEYQNAIRDLLVVDVDGSILLPADDASYGFDNVTAGELSPSLLDRYISAARTISRAALGSPTKSPGGETVQLPPDLTQEEHFDQLPLGTRGGLSLRYSFPANAEYEISVRLTRDRNEHVEGLTGSHQIEFLVDGNRVGLFTVQPPGPGKDHHAVDQDLHVRIPVKAGPHTVAATFPKRPSTLLETERQPYEAHFNMDRHPRIQPAVYQLSVNGPYDSNGPGDTPSRRRILVCKPASPNEEEPCAKRIVTALLRRAYRRPVTDADAQAPMKFYRDARAEGHEAGVEMALRSVLVSPEFLFRVEPDPPGTAPQSVYRVNDFQLATRLSFFLWSSIPDDELLDAAAHGKLHQPAELEHQTRRMLADPRSSSLVTNFADQWLYLRNLDSLRPDMRAFPDFDDNLRQAFRQETELFFESVMREDRSILDLLRTNYTFLNERLAKHYGIPNIYGSRFRRVTFQPGSERGGLLRQGSILAVTSYPTRTSPVIRGKWILSNLMGVPPPAKPDVVPPLKEVASVEAVSMRERMAEHRDNPACSGCHQLMDPIGFSLENYDAVGRWRASEDGKPIDASGGLPDGGKFEGVDGLERALLARPEVFAGVFTEKLSTYALGRGMEFYDAPAVRAVVRNAQAKNYSFSSFIVGIVSSASFQMRRSQ